MRMQRYAYHLPEIYFADVITPLPFCPLQIPFTFCQSSLTMLTTPSFQPSFSQVFLRSHLQSCTKKNHNPNKNGTPARKSLDQKSIYGSPHILTFLTLSLSPLKPSISEALFSPDRAAIWCTPFTRVPLWPKSETRVMPALFLPLAQTSQRRPSSCIMCPMHRHSYTTVYISIQEYSARILGTAAPERSALQVGRSVTSSPSISTISPFYDIIYRQKIQSVSQRGSGRGRDYKRGRGRKSRSRGSSLKPVGRSSLGYRALRSLKI